MERKLIEALYGGDCQIDFEAETKVKHLTVKVKIQVPVEEEYPHHGTTEHTGYMHVDITDAKDLRDALTVWLEEHGA